MIVNKCLPIIFVCLLVSPFYHNFATYNLLKILPTRNDCFISSLAFSLTLSHKYTLNRSFYLNDKKNYKNNSLELLKAIALHCFIYFI